VIGEDRDNAREIGKTMRKKRELIQMGGGRQGAKEKNDKT